MKKIVLLLTAITLTITACELDDYPFGPDGMPDSQQAITNLKDPALSWSADSYEATLGAENSFPTLTDIYGVGVAYESSRPDVATINGSGAITLVGSVRH